MFKKIIIDTFACPQRKATHFQPETLAVIRRTNLILKPENQYVFIEHQGIQCFVKNSYLKQALEIITQTGTPITMSMEMLLNMSITPEGSFSNRHWSIISQQQKPMSKKQLQHIGSATLFLNEQMSHRLSSEVYEKFCQQHAAGEINPIKSTHTIELLNQLPVIRKLPIVTYKSSGEINTFINTAEYEFRTLLRIIYEREVAKYALPVMLTIDKNYQGTLYLEHIKSPYKPLSQLKHEKLTDDIRLQIQDKFIEFVRKMIMKGIYVGQVSFNDTHNEETSINLPDRQFGRDSVVPNDFLYYLDSAGKIHLRYLDAESIIVPKQQVNKLSNYLIIHMTGSICGMLSRINIIKAPVTYKPVQVDGTWVRLPEERQTFIAECRRGFIKH